MKIISGLYKGREIKGYDIIGTRPTMNRIKESLFAMIQNYLDEAIVLDLFSGTGNYGIEALSNGSKYVYFNDLNPKCIKVIKDNLDYCNIKSNYEVLNLDYNKCLDYLHNKNIKFDLIFLDPPYKEDIINSIISKINEYDLLNNKGLIICELTNNNLLNNYKDLSIYKTRKYGDKEIIIYKKSLQ